MNQEQDKDFFMSRSAKRPTDKPPFPTRIAPTHVEVQTTQNSLPASQNRSIVRTVSICYSLPRAPEGMGAGKWEPNMGAATSTYGGISNSARWCAVSLSVYGFVGNAAPFFEVGTGAYLDGRTRAH